MLGTGADGVVFWHPLRRDGGRAPPPPAGLKATETAESNGAICRGTPPGRTKPETAERGLIPHAKPTRRCNDGQRVLRPGSLGTPEGLSDCIRAWSGRFFGEAASRLL